MGKEGAKNKDGQWYSIQKAVVDGEQKEMGDINGQTGKLRANLYDAEGNPVLMVVEIPQDGIPLETLKQFQQALTLQNLTPVMIIPPQVKFLQLKEMSNVEVRRMKDSLRHEDAKPPKMPPAGERRILTP